MRVISQKKVILDIGDFDAIEKMFSLKLPDFFKRFMFQYEGAFVGSLYYRGEEVFKEVLYVYPPGGSIQEILKGHHQFNIVGFIPFAIDSGGWDFNVSINPDTYGQVWVNKFDSGEEDTMEFVAPSFEEFIRELKPEE
jgi:hypothetical protein